MGMDEVMIGAIIQAVCACSGSETHAKQLRLQRVSLGKQPLALSPTAHLVAAGLRYMRSARGCIGSLGYPRRCSRTLCVGTNGPRVFCW